MEKPFSFSDYLTRQSRYAPDTELATLDGRTFWASGPLIDAVAAIVELPGILGDERIYAEWWIEGKIPPSMVQRFSNAGFVDIRETGGMRYFMMSEHVQLIANSMITAYTLPDGEYVYGTRDPRTGRQTRIKHPVAKVISKN